MGLRNGLKKIVTIFEAEDIPYMIVGGFATGYYNHFRFTSDIDVVLQIYPHHIDKLVAHFPEWMPFVDGFKENAQKGIVFNLTDFETGMKYDFMTYQDSDYNWTAFERRKKVGFAGIECYIASPEDLIIAKMIWYNISKSGKLKEDIEFLLRLDGINKQYLELWTIKLFIKRHGLF